MIILRQKEFGWIRKLLEKSMQQNIADLNKVIDRLKTAKRIVNPDIEKKIMGTCLNNQAEVFSADKYNGGESIVCLPNKRRTNDLRTNLENPLNFYTEDEIELLVLLILKSDAEISTIFWDRYHGLEELAHEIGHVKNYNGNLLSRFINKGADFSKQLLKLSPGALNALLSALGSINICWEEANATKKGYNILKTFGLSSEDLKLAKENMELALQTYKLVGKEIWKEKLINSKIPQWLL